MVVSSRVLRRTLAVTAIAGGAGAVGACSSSNTSSSGNAAAPATGGAGSSLGGGAPAGTGGNVSSAGGGSPSTSGGSAGTTGSEMSGGSAGAKAGSGGSAGSAGGHSSSGGYAGREDGAAGSGGSSGHASTAGAAGANANDPACPASLTAAFNGNGAQPCPQSGLTCAVPVDCNGPRTSLTVTCEDGKWGPTGCDTPYDFCVDATGGSGTFQAAADCVDGTWAIEVGYKPYGPTPCPAEAPADAMPCDTIGGTESGGDRKHCGYPCSDPAKWTVVSCVASGSNGAWSSDGACH